MTDAGASRWPGIAAAMLVLGTLPLIFVGGLVTTTASGMAVPDWPTTFGHNMLLAPFRLWRAGGALVEHSHRLLGMAVGLLTIHLLIALAIREPRRWVKALGVAALAGVIGQGVLGGLRVVLVENGLAFVHGCTAQLFLALAAAIAVVTGKAWTGGAPALAVDGGRAGRARRLAVVLAALAYAQIVLGAVLRHQVNHASLASSGLHLHITVALAVLALAAFAARAARRTGAPALARTARFVHGAIGLQLLLGVLVWRLKPAAIDIDLKVAIATAHVLGGSLVLGSTVALALGTWRFARDVGGVPAPTVAEPAAAGVTA